MPPAVAMLVWVYALKLDPAFLAEAVSFRLFYLLFFLVLSVELVSNVRRRCLSATLLCTGIILMLFQGLVWYGYRFSGMAAVGADEQITEYYTASSGALIKPPRIPLKVVTLTAEPKRIILTRDGVETRLDAGSNVQRDGFVFRLETIEQAPLISVRNVRGEPVDEAYLKLTSSGEREDFIMFGRLPHRFYVREVRSPESGAAMFRLMVVRDKLTIVDSLVQAGESVYFDGHYVVCQQGAPWARLSVKKRQSLLPLWTGLFLASAAVVCAVATGRGGRG
jgi:hypothetical protein